MCPWEEHPKGVFGCGGRGNLSNEAMTRHLKFPNFTQDSKPIHFRSPENTVCNIYCHRITTPSPQALLAIMTFVSNIYASMYLMFLVVHRPSL